MGCIKCGRETNGKDVFCADCLRVMAASPVKPGTPVILPRRDIVTKRSQPRKQVKLENQIARMRKMLRWLWVAVAVLSILLVISAAALFHRVAQQKETPALGQNYSTSSSGTTPADQQ